MATTVQQIIDAAYGTSKRNRPGVIANEEVELLGVVQRELRHLFSEGVKYNRWFYVVRNTVVWDATFAGWAMPTMIESVVRIERTTGAQVYEVPVDQKTIERGEPCVYFVGQKFYPAGNPLDPSNESLWMYCSKMPASLTLLTSVLDPMWPEQFNDLLILRVAMYLSIKDGNRGDEVAAFEVQYKVEFDRYVEFLKHATTTLVRAYGHEGLTNTSQTQPTP